MPIDREELAAQIFGDVAELTETERAALLERRCAGDSLLRSEVEALLAADAQGGSEDFLSPPAISPIGHTIARPGSSFEDESHASSVGVGSRVGRYRIVRVIASGGMGTVYEAAQEQPRRTVALKVMRAALASPAMLRRFEYEGQVLGSLQHPGIAQVYEAGTDAAGERDGRGVPFITMELIPDARPLVDYAVAAGLSLQDRIALMARVCDAMQYAHQRGVIHRDLKPGNILVDASGQPKVIDFGVASVTGADITAPSMQTSPGQLLGTLRYMSPEQCEGDSRKIDTRSDVYALGVVLFELLTGKHPYDLSSTSIAGACRVIREVAPIRPSLIDQTVRGDVETIILKALEKEPERRYQSAGDLGADLRRWLAHEPILARPPSAVYQLRKFARRNRALVTGVGIALLALVAGTIGTSWQAVRAIHQRNLADEARLTADKARDRAESEAETSRRITEFFEDLLASADPDRSMGKVISVQELVDTAAANIGDSLKDQPLVEAGVRAALGKTYVGLGDYPKAESHLREAIRIRQEKLGADAPATLEVRHNLLAIYWMQGKLDEALPEAEAVLAGNKARFGAGSFEYYHAMDGLATILGARSEYERAIALNREALEGLTRLRGRDDPDAFLCLNNLAFKLDSTGRSADAEPMFREAVETSRRIKGEDHPDTISYMVTHANCLRTLKRLDDAEPLALEALERRRKIYPANHPLTGDACELMGRIRFARQDWAVAADYLNEALDNHRISLPKDSWRTGVTAAWVGMSYTKIARYDEAEKLLLEAHATLQKTKGQHPTQENGTIKALVDLYTAWQKPERAAEFSALLESPAPAAPGADKK